MKKVNKFLAFALAFAMVLTLVPGFEIPVTVAADVSDGNSDTETGVAENVEAPEVSHLTEVPEGYVGIYTKEDLNNVRNNLAGNYILMNDIEFTDADFAESGDFYYSGEGWQPIGYDTKTVFKGIFDGNGYIIKNLCVRVHNSSSDSYAGLFGYVQSCTIQNLGVVDANISAISEGSYESYAGGIVGYLGGGVIRNCYFAGNVRSSSSYKSSGNDTISYAGGIAGYISGYYKSATVNNCYNMGVVFASSRSSRGDCSPHAGGIAGCSSHATVKNCYNAGFVSSTASAAYDSYAYPCAGGIAGEVNQGSLSSCYNVGEIQSTASASSVSKDSTFGGITGAIYISATIQNCYYLDSAPKGVGDGTDTCIKCTFEQMEQTTTYAEFDFVSTWYFDTSLGYLFPQLQGMSLKPENTTKFAGGRGFFWDPYRIESKMHLNNVRNYPNDYFILVNDIEFTDEDFAEGGAFYNSGKGWTPIGASSSNAFKGTFDGNGYAIKNLYININITTYIYDDIHGGLFCFVDGGTIKNLGMINSNISVLYSHPTNSNSFAGGIVSYISNSTVYNCYNTGNITSDGGECTYAGGIAGYMSNSTIYNCYNTGSVLSDNSWTDSTSGGIVGYMTSSTVYKCYNTGRVSADNGYALAGGIVGEAKESGTINNCYNVGDVSASSGKYYFAGGIVANSYAEISCCYNVGNVYPYRGISCSDSSDCYYLIDPDNEDDLSNSASAKRTIEELKLQETYVGFDFENVWYFDENLEYPFPQLRGISFDSGNTTEFAGGNGSFWDPYQIESTTHLNNVRNYPNDYFILVNDIEFTDEDFAEGGAFYNSGKGWTPIGASSSNAFKGTFDGNGYAIKNLYINTDSIAAVGLFGCVRGGTIKNLGMVDSDITGRTTGALSYVGGVVGYLDTGVINNCYNTGRITSVSTYGTYDDFACAHAGGIVGYIEEMDSTSHIVNCYNTGEVCATAPKNSACSGGIIGRIEHGTSGTFCNLYNTGAVSVTAIESYVGGILGLDNQYCYFRDCYNAGNINATSTECRFANVGGIAGCFGGSMDCCYNIGNVSSIVSISTAAKINVGGIVGTGSNIQGCYNTGHVSATGNSTLDQGVVFDIRAGGIVGTVDGGNNVHSCFNTGKISAINSTSSPDNTDGRCFAGGISGELVSGGLINCYNVGAVEAVSVNGSAVYIGGICGSRDSDVFGKCKSCYYLETIANGSCNTRNCNCKQCTAQEMMQQSTFAEFDFDARWTMAGNEDYFYPELQGVEMKFTKELESMAVTLLKKTEYVEGESLDLTGGKLILSYNNDTTEGIDLSKATVTGFDNTKVGEQTLTVTYEGKTCEFKVKVVVKSLVSIEVTTKPTKVEYLEAKDPLDLAGGKLTLTFNNDTTEEIDLSKATVTGFDNTKVGDQSLTVTYNGKTTTFKVKIIAKALTSIAVTTKPSKLTYLEGDSFSKTGMVVTAYYNNNTSAVITDYAISGYTSTPGTKTITVSYGGKSASFNATVNAKSLTSIAVTTKPSKLTYLEGDSLNKTGMVVAAYYNNGTSSVISDYTVSGYTSTPGTKTITVSYGGKTTTFNVEVVAKSLVSISVTTNPAKTEYLEAKDPLDLAGGKLTLSYNNGTTTEIELSEAAVTGFDNTQIGEQILIVIYEGNVATFKVNVIAKTLSSIAVTAKPSKLAYLEGESFDKSGMVVTAYYNNNTSAVITDYTVSGYSSTVGTKTVTVSYGGKTATFTITVKSRVPSSITSSKFTVSGGNISKIPAGTTVSALLAGINEGAYCKVYKGNSEVSGSAVVGTGMVVKLLDGNTVKASCTVVVTGDTNGDGNITITDMIAIKAHILKKTLLSGAAAKAADTNGDNSISITDFIQVKAKILGKGTITAR